MRTLSYREHQETYRVISHTDRRDGVGVVPKVVLHKVHTVLFHVLTAITERLPILLPFHDGLVQGL
jgi:hypothetical protein